MNNTLYSRVADELYIVYREKKNATNKFDVSTPLTKASFLVLCNKKDIV